MTYIELQCIIAVYLEVQCMNNINKQLMAASSIPLILTIIKAQETYGYEIIQKIKLLSDGEMEWKDGSLYPVLKKMEQKDLIQSRWRKTSGGKQRKYYSITIKGSLHLNDEVSQWNKVNSMMQSLWQDHVSAKSNLT